MKAGQEHHLWIETDWSLPNISPDFAVTAWATESPVSITHNKGIESDHFPLQGFTDAFDSSDLEPEPQPKPEPTPDPEPEFDFDAFIASRGIHHDSDSSCGQEVQIIKLVPEAAPNAKAIYAGHNCSSQKM